MRKIKFANGEFYHIFNRGVDKRIIFNNAIDIERFFQSMNEFNVVDPVGGIYQNSILKKKDMSSMQFSKEKLISFACYCLNPNHYHFIIKQIADNGIEKFMHKLGLGYTKYFNGKYKRSGALFQGTYKAVHISSNEQLLHTSVYVNLNYRVHKLKFKNLTFKSSWNEYIDNKQSGQNNFCNKEMVLGQFKSKNEYKKFAEKTLEDIKSNKEIESFNK